MCAVGIKFLEIGYTHNKKGDTIMLLIVFNAVVIITLYVLYRKLSKVKRVDS